MNSDGSGIRKLTDVGHHPTWSPDQQKIAYECGNSISIIVLSILNIDYVVAHWVNGALDANDPCQISLDQILQAIAWWAAATPVPHTGGQTIDLDKILDLIAKWAAATCIESSSAPQALLIPKALPAAEAASVVEATRNIDFCQVPPWREDRSDSHRGGQTGDHRVGAR